MSIYGLGGWDLPSTLSILSSGIGISGESSGGADAVMPPGVIAGFVHKAVAGAIVRKAVAGAIVHKAVAGAVVHKAVTGAIFPDLQGAPVRSGPGSGVFPPIRPVLGTVKAVMGKSRGDNGSLMGLEALDQSEYGSLSLDLHEGVKAMPTAEKSDITKSMPLSWFSLNGSEAGSPDPVDVENGGRYGSGKVSVSASATRRKWDKAMLTAEAAAVVWVLCKWKCNWISRSSRWWKWRPARKWYVVGVGDGEFPDGCRSKDAGEGVFREGHD